MRWQRLAWADDAAALDAQLRAVGGDGLADGPTTRRGVCLRVAGSRGGLQPQRRSCCPSRGLGRAQLRLAQDRCHVTWACHTAGPGPPVAHHLAAKRLRRCSCHHASKAQRSAQRQWVQNDAKVRGQLGQAYLPACLRGDAHLRPDGFREARSREGPSVRHRRLQPPIRVRRRFANGRERERAQTRAAHLGSLCDGVDGLCRVRQRANRLGSRARSANCRRRERAGGRDSQAG
mmetsp:Transcript_3405/g.14033  ORF Transcript_3405/g.14033 Transcript_3405/m.14033 type:complete len:233 (+) Transcript_3405:2315-3013(+)